MRMALPAAVDGVITQGGGVGVARGNASSLVISPWTPQLRQPGRGRPAS